MTTLPPGVPEGFSLAPIRGPFVDMNGPFWQSDILEAGRVRFGFLPGARHTNSLGFVHGGMLSTFIDNIMAQTVYSRFQCRLVTEDLRVSFKAAVFKKRWVEASTEIVQSEDQLVKTKAELISRGAVCTVAQGVYRIFP